MATGHGFTWKVIDKDKQHTEGGYEYVDPMSALTALLRSKRDSRGIRVYFEASDSGVSAIL